MERYLDFIKKFKKESKSDCESEQDVEPTIHSVDSLSKEFFNENSPKLSLDSKNNDKKKKNIF